MAKKLQIKRGARASMPTLAQGELGMTTDTYLVDRDNDTNWSILVDIFIT